MARQQMYPQPWRKHIEAYNDFGGGLNTVTSNDNLRVDEVRHISNMDLGDRGSLIRRAGMRQHLVPPEEVTGLGQGYFRYYLADGTYEEIVAIGGKLYKDGEYLEIVDLSSFQTTRLIEAVQYGTILYIATGTKFVQYDGTTAEIVTAFTPDPLSALYIGTNGLADDPDSYLTDGVGTVIKLTGVTVDRRYGVINAPSVFTAYMSKPAGITLEYQFEYRVKDATTWTVGQAWNASKTWTFIPLITEDFEIHVITRDVAVPATTYEYVMPRYTVKETDENIALNHDTIQDCNRIMMYWDRLILYGDPTQPRTLFVSHLRNMTYFPIPNSLEITNEKQEVLNIIIQYRDSLVCFTDTNIQAVFGKFPAEFVRVKQHSSIGCIAPESAAVVENSILFRSRDGIHALRSVSISEDRADVRRVDDAIENIVPEDRDACGVSYDSQYHILFPQQEMRLRYYYGARRKPWTRDDSSKLTFSRFYRYEDGLYGQAQDTGVIYFFHKEDRDDAGYVYTDSFELKSFDFGEPYNPKKLKEIQVLMEQQATRVSGILRVYADSALVLDPDDSFASVVDGIVVWNVVTTPNLTIDSGTVFGSWLLGTSPFGGLDSILEKLRLYGKCRRVRVTYEHTAAESNRFLGCAFIFKTKKP